MDAQPKKILIAEDDRFLRQAAARVLERNGFEVATAKDGEEAIERIRADRPDLVLLDLIMPKVQGFEVLAAIKQDATLATIPIVVFSNLSQDTDLQRCREAGAVDFLIKSNLSLEDLVQYVSRATRDAGEKLA